MRIITKQVMLTTEGYTHILDVTGNVQGLISEAEMIEGQALVFAVGSTAGVTTIEYEPGLVETDLKKLLDQFAPYDREYAHNKTWGDNNGAAHLRSSLLGSSLTVPFAAGKLLLGTWQQVVLIDFDTRPRSRKMVIQLTGE